MEKYISKSAVVAEIERRLEVLANTSAGDNKEFAAIIGAQHYELINLVQYINTLEVKEMDLEEEITRVSKNEYFDFTDWKSIARHFFELGLGARKEE